MKNKFILPMLAAMVLFVIGVSAFSAKEKSSLPVKAKPQTIEWYLNSTDPADQTDPDAYVRVDGLPEAPSCPGTNSVYCVILAADDNGKPDLSSIQVQSYKFTQ